METSFPSETKFHYAFLADFLETKSQLKKAKYRLSRYCVSHSLSYSETAKLPRWPECYIQFRRLSNRFKRLQFAGSKLLRLPKGHPASSTRLVIESKRGDGVYVSKTTPPLNYSKDPLIAALNLGPLEERIFRKPNSTLSVNDLLPAFTTQEANAPQLFVSCETRRYATRLEDRISALEATNTALAKQYADLRSEFKPSLELTNLNEAINRIKFYENLAVMIRERYALDYDELPPEVGLSDLHPFKMSVKPVEVQPQQVSGLSPIRRIEFEEEIRDLRKKISSLQTEAKQNNFASPPIGNIRATDESIIVTFRRKAAINALRKAEPVRKFVWTNYSLEDIRYLLAEGFFGPLMLKPPSTDSPA